MIHIAHYIIYYHGAGQGGAGRVGLKVWRRSACPMHWSGHDLPCSRKGRVQPRPNAGLANFVIPSSCTFHGIRIKNIRNRFIRASISHTNGIKESTLNFC